MAVNRLKVTICGTSYTLVSDEPISIMRELAAELDTTMTQLIKENAHINTTMAAVLTALDSTDRANKEQAAADHLRLDMKHAIDERERLQDELADARAEVERLQTENRQLRGARK